MNDIQSVLFISKHKLGWLGEQALPEAQVLLQYVMHKDRAWIVSHPDAFLTFEQEAQFFDLLDRRTRREPLPYLVGHWEFYGMDFLLTPDVLIPRPETELLVEVGSRWLEAHSGEHWIADVGTGSACIAVALAKAYPHSQVVALDISMPALKISHMNIHKNQVEDRVHLLQGSLLEAVSCQFDLICANLPYIPTRSLDGLEVAQYEPRTALDGGTDGLQWIKQLIDQALEHLSPGGLLALEIQFDQGDQVVELVKKVFKNVKVEKRQDLAGLDRVITVEI
jgi:release factor glutamine methyltransferase